MAIDVDALARSLPENIRIKLVELVIEECKRKTMFEMPGKPITKKRPWPDFFQMACPMLGITREQLQKYLSDNRSAITFPPIPILRSAKTLNKQGALQTIRSELEDKPEQLKTLTAWFNRDEP